MQKAKNKPNKQTKSKKYPKAWRTETLTTPKARRNKHGIQDNI